MKNLTLALLLAFWGAVECIRKNNAAVQLCHGWGFQFNTALVMFETRTLNAYIHRVGEESNVGIQAFLSLWFLAGVAVFAMLQLVLFVGLIAGFVSSLERLTSGASGYDVATESSIRPVIPGYNADSSDIPVTAAALLLTLAFHEFGHAIAAATQRVRTEGAGLFLLVVMPGAFVRLEEGLLPQLPPLSQLKVYCAGAFHNLVFALWALVSVQIAPLFLSPVYEGAYRRRNSRNRDLPLDLSSGSPFYRLGRPDDSLMALDEHHIVNSETLHGAIHSIAGRARFAQPVALLIPSENITTNKVVQLLGFCIDTAYVTKRSQGEDCFIVDLPSNTIDLLQEEFSRADTFRRVCTKSSSLLAEARLFEEKKCKHGCASEHAVISTCRRRQDCASTGEPITCARAEVDPGESFISIHLVSGVSYAWRGDAMADGFASAFRPARMRLRKSWSSCIRALGEKIIHLGWNPKRIHGATDSVISWLVSWPRVLFKFLDSVQHVSISIALLNALPIYGLDGQLALVQFIRIWLLSSPPPLVPASLRGREPSEQEQAARERHHDWNAVHMRQRRFSRFILVLGSALAIFNCALGFAAVFMNGP